MKAPSHPGEILQTMYLDPLNVTITRAAEALGVSRKHVSAIANASASVTPDMAARPTTVFGPSVQFWVNLQAQCDVWAVSQSRLQR
jgi:addiction module HigA family antidote